MNLSKPVKLQKFNSTQLKTVALLCMLADHTACGILWHRLLRALSLAHPESLQFYLRQAGRTAFPIFSFFLAEGFYHTKNFRKYIMRMSIFSILSEMPFNLCLNGTLFSPEHQNVYFTLTLGLLTMHFCEKTKNATPSIWEFRILSLGIAFFFGLVATVLRFDYQLPGILLIVVFYLWHDSFPIQLALGAVLLLWEPASLLAFLLLLFYNGQRGCQNKYFFYLFYPVHLGVLYLITFTKGL